MNIAMRRPGSSWSSVAHTGGTGVRDSQPGHMAQWQETPDSVQRPRAADRLSCYTGKRWRLFAFTYVKNGDVVLDDLCSPFKL